MKKVYLDNAATTELHAEVISTMVEVLQNDFGNPSRSPTHFIEKSTQQRHQIQPSRRKNRCRI